MSLLLRDRLDLAIGHDAIELTLTAKGWRQQRRDHDRVELADQDSTYGNLIDQLDGMLAPHAKARAHLVLADRFVHYSVVPWLPGLGPAQLQLVVRADLQAALGIELDAFEVVADTASHGHNIVACAIPRDLLQRLGDCLAANGITLVSLQPGFVAMANRWRKRLGADALLVSVEPDRCVLGSRRAGQWHSLRVLQTPASQAEAVLAIIRREQLLLGMEDCPASVHLHRGIDAAGFAQEPSIQLLGQSS